MAEKVEMTQEMYDMLVRDAGLGHVEMSDRDSACGILPDLDYEAQLIAISALLRRNDQADAETERQIKEVDEYARKTSGWRNQRAVDEWVDLLHGSTYQGAAHSMAALGMLAPFYESMFFQAFQGIRKQYFGMDVIPLGHARSDMAKAEDFWDCHFLYNANTRRFRLTSDCFTYKDETTKESCLSRTFSPQNVQTPAVTESRLKTAATPVARGYQRCGRARPE